MRPEGRLACIFGSGTSEKAGRAEALELASSPVRRDQFSTFRTLEVGGGSMGYHLFRRPPMFGLCVWGFGMWVRGFIFCVFGVVVGLSR